MSKTLAEIIRNLHWMARRYADGRSSYAPSLLNSHVKELVELGYELRPPLYARDGMGRNFDGLSDEDVRAAEEDMSTGHLQVVTETDERMKALRDVVIEECAKAIFAKYRDGMTSTEVADIVRSLMCQATSSLKGEPSSPSALQSGSSAEAEVALLREACQPIAWLTNLHEQNRHGRDDPDTTSIFVALGVLRKVRDAFEATHSQTPIEEAQSADEVDAEDRSACLTHNEDPNG